MSEKTLTCVAVFAAREGKAQQLKEVLDDLVVHTRKEPGCLSYEVFTSTEDSQRFLVNELYKSKADFEFHSNTSYLKALKSALPKLVEEADIRTY
ncbi:putative quinol monooxygenase [Vibrio porteresiae]|uniref:Quinol monooxygenase n=1 Tax=Vibrio porteresiae DSM 19223 TaxID=1123496 RepID=A0ABZ0QFH0_9VIBR|nr:putative quinol monooxygenase [Vibrio porteresiae]WPC75208.1 putative quinol monooxygenase [Vibrio porteresiae DSM 19223]